MKVEQVYGILNSLAQDVLGRVQYVNDSTGLPYDSSNNMYVLDPTDSTKVIAVDPTTGAVTSSATAISGNFTPSYFVATDLTNVVDVGRRILDAASTSGKDYSTIYASLINHIGKVVFVDRVYRPLLPSIERSNWEFGSVVEKIDADMPDTTYNVKWELSDKTTYNQDMFHKPQNVRAKFFNDAVTFEIEMSFTEDQLKQSFSSANQLNSFFSMIATKISNKMTMNFAALTRSTICSLIAATMYREFSSILDSTTHKYDWTDASAATLIAGSNRAINLLALYKAEVSTADPTLTAAQCIKDPEFIRYAVHKMGIYSDRMAEMSTLFNIGGKERFTPKDLQHYVLLTDFSKAVGAYLESDTFHNEFVALAKHETINYWQATGNHYEFGNTSRIAVKANVSTDGETVTQKVTDFDGVLGVIFDNDAVGINNEKQKTTSHYNAKGDFVNNFYKAFARYYEDMDENCIVFFVA